MSAIVLSIRGLRKSFARGLARCTHRKLAITDVDLDLFHSEIVGLAGCEGAGKTTLLQCACGLLRPDSGSVIARHPVAYVPPVPIYYPFLTVRDVISIRASRAAPRGTETLGETLDLLELYHARNEIVATLTPAELVRLSIAEAIIGNPRAVLIDTSGAAPFIDGPGVQHALSRIASAGTAIMIAGRDCGALESVAARVILLREGSIVNDQPAPMFVAERLH